MDRQKVIDILSSNGLKAQSRFGQNFLCDDEVTDKIIEITDIKPGARILEIGPGLGALTEKVLAIPDTLYTAVEIDNGLFEYLVSEYGQDGFIHSDYLKLAKTDYKHDKFDVVLSNIPYYVMTPIMKKLLCDCFDADVMAFMVEDVAIDRICAAPSTKQYGPLAVLFAVYGKVNKEFTVPSGSFWPMPHTTSAVISVRKDAMITIDEDFCDFIEACFSMRRKTMVNSLKSWASSRNKDIKAVLAEAGLPSDVRAETLTAEQFVGLYKAFLL